MRLSTFLSKVRLAEKVDFNETMEIIDENYTFSPIQFKNGNTLNKAGENSGSCKLFAFAKVNNLSKTETLSCFGDYYLKVLKNPEGNDHQNIRNFMITGWEGITFEGKPLTKK